MSWNHQMNNVGAFGGVQNRRFRHSIQTLPVTIIGLTSVEVQNPLDHVGLAAAKG
jgi:hypothetical protein